MSRSAFVSDRSSDDAKHHRRQAGAFLKSLRQKLGYTQKELAHKLNFEYYTFISQIENGGARLPTDYFGLFAQVFGLDTRQFSLYMVKLYDPTLFKWLTYGSKDAELSETDFL